MESIFIWFGNHPGFLGYLTGILIFAVTLFCLSRQWIGFFITLLLLLFSLVAGFSVAHNDQLIEWMTKSPQPQTQKPIEETHDA